MLLAFYASFTSIIYKSLCPCRQNKFDSKAGTTARAIETLPIFRLAELQSPTKLLARSTILTENEHFPNLPLPTPNTMLSSIPATMRQYSNIVLGEMGARNIEHYIPKWKILATRCFFVKCAKDF